MVVVFRL